MLNLTAHDLIFVLTASLMVLGVLSIASGIILLVVRGQSKAVHTIANQTARLAQKGIGRGTGQGNVIRRCVNCLRIFSMLITWMISALALESDSMRSRGSLLRGRTAFSIYRFDNRDRAFAVTLCALMTLTAMAAILGAGTMWYDPRILWKPLTGPSAVTALGYAALCLLPMTMELWTEQQFQKARRAA